MNVAQRDQWVDEVIRQVLAALAHAPELRSAIIFKGAWILNAHLRDNRHSLDIDANAAADWAAATPQLDDQRAFFEETIQKVVNRAFERQTPVRFRVTSVKVTKSPPREHPRQWTAFKVRLTVADAKFDHVRGLPPVEMDIAAPEELGPNAVATIDLLGAPARVYALHRIAGEKLRAYLTSLPQYRSRHGGGERTFRAKDLFDLARIVRARALSDLEFWRAVAVEFRLACASRLVDCEGLSTFRQEWTQARATYEADATLSAISFTEAEAALVAIATFLNQERVFPLHFPAA